MAGKFEIFNGRDRQFYFRLKAGNGEPILASEGYLSKASCQNGISSVKVNSRQVANFEMRQTSGGNPYFVLKAANHEIIGKSEVYSSNSAAENGIQSVMTNAPTAIVVDLATQ